MHAHRGGEILVLPASCSSGSGHHHCHFTSDCTDSGNCLLLAGEQHSGKGWEALEAQQLHSCLSAHESLLLTCLWILLMSQCAFLTLGEDSRVSLV